MLKQSNVKSTLLLIGADKGGVGKTMLACLRDEIAKALGAAPLPPANPNDAAPPTTE
jgi:hypothetical protein